MSRPTVLVVEHDVECPPALFGEWLVEAGCDLDVRRPYAGDELPGLTAYDGFVVLGGPMGANDDAQHPWLAPVKELVREARDVGLPTLGICLGHQLVAVALGGSVVVETIFTLPGLGQLAYQSVIQRDMNTLMGIIFLCSIIVVVVNFPTYI